MITAVDTNVLLDVFGSDPGWLEPSRQALRTCMAEGALVACEVVWAEVASCFPTVAAARAAMERLGVGFDPATRETSLEAGRTWALYRSRGGRRQRLVADFLIGAHASTRADRLLTRDRGFYRSYFADLTVVEPRPS